jgi:hypothetical protein
VSGLATATSSGFCARAISAKECPPGPAFLSTSAGNWSSTSSPSSNKKLSGKALQQASLRLLPRDDFSRPDQAAQNEGAWGLRSSGTEPSLTTESNVMGDPPALPEVLSLLRENGRKARCIFKLPVWKCNVPHDRGQSGVEFHAGDWSSGMGVTWNSFLHSPAVKRAHFLDFFLRELSVEIPVPAYICL